MNSATETPNTTTNNETSRNTETTTAHTTTTAEVATFEYPAEEGEVIFVPNEKDLHRIEDVENEFYNRPVLISDMISKTAIGDVMKKAETEPPNQDILFISGKNAEQQEKEPQKESEKHLDTRRDGNNKQRIKKKLDCKNLNCRNKLESVCGVKTDHNQLKHRLFLNECFFRKVNCAFKYEENRYKQVDNYRCRNVGAHLPIRPSVTPTPPTPAPPKQDLNMRRSFSSRRSMNRGIDGSFCSHPCPSSCPDDYDPECAVSKKGERKVFVNHCKLDMNSCFYGEVWQQRPLAECVGGKKADMRQNRGFIAWMQRVGMVNNKGKLMI
ncbi:uncharacterized protein LOC106133677 [Amyelois transitella]|uniref:uncharacterized protein LOC106133677 n=1 Tax=Amyelois transitella TaxID=680683 RepID=UPI00299054C2|nr:uncharacterized protein LOC106133677 [Amyelois transitella]